MQEKPSVVVFEIHDDALGETYIITYEPGMTWEQWVTSIYNTDGFTVDVYYNEVCRNNRYIASSGSPVHTDDTIDPQTNSYDIWVD